MRVARQSAPRLSTARVRRSVTFPSRAFGASNDRRYFEFLRSAEGTGGDVKRVKTWILEEFRASSRAA